MKRNYLELALEARREEIDFLEHVLANTLPGELFDTCDTRLENLKFSLRSDQFSAVKDYWDEPNTVASKVRMARKLYADEEEENLCQNILSEIKGKGKVYLGLVVHQLRGRADFYRALGLCIAQGKIVLELDPNSHEAYIMEVR